MKKNKTILSLVIIIPLLSSVIYASITPVEQSNMLEKHQPVINDGLVGYWSFDDGTATDNSDNGHDGSFNSNPQRVTGKFNDALDFDGIDDSIRIDHHDDFNFGTDDFSFALWFKQDVQGGSNNDFRQLLCKRIPGSGNNPNLECQIQNDILKVPIGDYAGYIELIYENVELYTWYHVCVVRDSGVCKLYINAGLEDSEISSHDLSFNRNLYIGNDDYKYENWDGVIDEVRIYKRALDKEEIINLYNQLNDDVSFFEDFDDGNIDDWEINNPTPGNNPITIEVSNEEYVSEPYSLKISSPNQNGYGANMTGPLVNIDINNDYQIEFDFRWNAFHYHNLFKFENLCIIIDKSWLRLKYWTESGSKWIGSKDFEDYCPRNTWTHFKFVAYPSNTSFTVFADGVKIGTGNYGSYHTGIHGFYIRDKGTPVSEPDYINNGYYDNIKISSITGNQPPTADFTYEPKYPTTQDDVQFIDLSYDNNDSLNSRGIASWWWDFGDGYYSDLQNPMHCFYYERIYFVSLTVTDHYGATDTVTHMIKVEQI